MSSALATAPNGAATPDIMYDVIAKGDLAKLTPDQKARYYVSVCESMGLNPMTKPFEYINLSGKEVLYATRTAADQLRKINGVSLEVVSEQTTPDGLRVVRVRATDKTGRTDEEIGAVNVKGLAADFLANAYMKAMTKAKRRATLSVCGLGWLDETEVETIPSAQRVQGPTITVEVDDDEPHPDPVLAGWIADDAESVAAVDADTGNPFLASIRDAANIEALRQIGAEIAADTSISDTERDVLTAAYKARLKDLGKIPASHAAGQSPLGMPRASMGK